MTQKILHRLFLAAFPAYEATSYTHNYLFSSFPLKHESLTPGFTHASSFPEMALPFFPPPLIP